MRVAMQVMTALLATVVVLSALVHMTGTSDSIIQGVSASQQMQIPRIRMEAHTHDVPDPSQSAVLQRIYQALGVSIDGSDDSDSVTLSVSFADKTIDKGDYVPMLKASDAPEIDIKTSSDDAGVYYTWILIDIDAPSPDDPNHSPFLHYIVANIDPTNEKTVTEVVSYYPVSPPKGNHRYISLLFTQDEKTSESKLAKYQDKFNKRRTNFDVAKYVDNEELTYVTRSYFFSHPAKTNDY